MGGLLFPELPDALPFSLHEKTQMNRPTILTGDRTTGPLHIGHYAGSLANRLRYQDSHEQFLLLADTQALTDNAHDPEKVRRSVFEVALDHLAVGIDPSRTAICLQSHLPALAELSMLYLNYVTVARLERNPTIKDEIRVRGFVPVSSAVWSAVRSAEKHRTISRILTSEMRERNEYLFFMPFHSLVTNFSHSARHDPRETSDGGVCAKASPEDSGTAKRAKHADATRLNPENQPIRPAA